MDTKQNHGDGLATIDEKNVAPKSRLSTAEAARSILTGLIRDDLPAAIQRTRIQAMIDGAPCYTDAQLEEANLGWVSRNNWGGARAKIRDYLTAFHDIVTSSSPLPKAHVCYGDPTQRVRFGQIISERFHQTLFDASNGWDFLWHMELHHKQLAVHGIGPCYWQGLRDWRFRALKRRSIMVPRDSPSDPTRLKLVFIRDEMPVDELWEKVRVPREKSKWNKEATFAAIKKAQKEGADTFTPERAEEKWKSNSASWASAESNMVSVAHCFVVEFSADNKPGRVSHKILTENTSGSGTRDAASNAGFLYDNIGAYQNMTQAVWVCLQDVGNGEFESVRGLGMEAYYFGEAQNRMNNSLVDNAITAGMVMWKSASPEGANKLTRIVLGPHAVVPADFEQVAINNGAAIQAQMAVANHFSDLEATTTGSYRTRAATPSHNARTATEVEAEVGETSKLTNSNVSHYLTQADRLLQETFRRLTLTGILEGDPGGTEALAFKQGCIDDGIPEDAFYEICGAAKIHMARPIGNGSYADRAARLSRISQFLGDMPERKRDRFIRDQISFIAGSSEAGEAYGPDLEEQYPGIEGSVAILENNSFGNGATQDPFSPDNAHTVHFEKHMEFGMQLLQGDPQAAAAALNPLGMHMAEHLEALNGDPTRRAEFAVFSQQFGEFMKAADATLSMAEDMAELEQPQTPEMMKVQLDAQRADFVAQSDSARKDQKTAQQLTLTRAKTIQKLELDRIKTKEAIQNERLRLAAQTRQKKDEANAS